MKEYLNTAFNNLYFISIVWVVTKLSFFKKISTSWDFMISFNFYFPHSIFFFVSHEIIAWLPKVSTLRAFPDLQSIAHQCNMLSHRWFYPKNDFSVIRNLIQKVTKISNMEKKTSNQICLVDCTSRKEKELFGMSKNRNCNMHCIVHSHKH